MQVVGEKTCANCMPGSLYIYQTFKQYQLRKCHKQSKITGNFVSLLPFLLPNLHNAQSANKQHYRNTFTSTLKIWGNEIQQFYFNELCFLNLFYFFSCFHTILKTKRGTFTFSRGTVKMISTGTTLESLKLNQLRLKTLRGSRLDLSGL